MFQLHSLNGYVYRLNIETGETWMLSNFTWVPVRQPAS